MFGRKAMRAAREEAARLDQEALDEYNRAVLEHDLTERRKAARRQAQEAFDNHGLPRKGQR
jgi:hypothetical protein